MSTPRVTLYSRPGCHLCDDARAVIEAVCADLGEAYEEVDITTDDGVMVNDATVVTTDVEASNGVIHVIDTVLVPPSVDVDALLG